jgi:hypothetical protein
VAVAANHSFGYAWRAQRFDALAACQRNARAPTECGDGDDGFGPVQPDAPHQTAQMSAHLLATGGFAGAQDGDKAIRRFGSLASVNETLGVAGRCVIDVDRQEAALVVVRMEQRQSLITMHRIGRHAFRSRHVNVPKRGGVVDIECDGFRWFYVTLAPQIHADAGQADQRPPDCNPAGMHPRFGAARPGAPIAVACRQR